MSHELDGIKKQQHRNCVNVNLNVIFLNWIFFLSHSFLMLLMRAHVSSKEGIGINAAHRSWCFLFLISFFLIYWLITPLHENFSYFSARLKELKKKELTIKAIHKFLDEFSPRTSNSHWVSLLKKEEKEEEEKSLMTMLLLDENNNLTWPYSELDDKLDILWRLFNSFLL